MQTADVSQVDVSKFQTPKPTIQVLGKSVSYTSPSVGFAAGYRLIEPFIKQYPRLSNNGTKVVWLPAFKKALTKPNAYLVGATLNQLPDGIWEVDVNYDYPLGQRLFFYGATADEAVTAAIDSAQKYQA
jgi:hypothetical protein